LSKTLVSKFLIAAPLAIVAVLALAIAWGYSFSNDAQAADPVNGQMELVVKSGAAACPPASTADVCAIKGQDFLLSVDLTKAPGSNYVGIQTEIDYGLLQYKPTATALGEVVWPDRADPLTLRSPAAPTGLEGLVNHASATGATPPFPESSFVGNLLELTINCTAGDSTGNVIDLVPLSGGNTNGSGLKPPTGANIPLSDTITVDCIQAPTDTPPPPTNTPPDFPQMQKLPALQNLWLTRDDPTDPKIPPVICSDDEDTATLTEALSIPIPAIPDPKDPSINQELGAFEFEIHFDDTKVCVNIVAATGPGEAAENMICVVEDKDSTLEGVARIGCVTQGKTAFPDTTTPEGRILARIVVRAQPDVYSQAKPNQDNGVVVQLNNVLCELADLQGHPIPVFSCEDADVTIRYLEGDVEPDCTINALDTQAIAFRWGVEKGSLIYTPFMNLEPSGPQADADIDIKDLQFVFGRFGSTCAVPHPDQDPVNAKA
jgi:hypothetical protein